MKPVWGRFDATNIIDPAVGVITNLSIEHTQYLGTTIQALATEKGGIIKPFTPLVTSVSQPSGIRTLRQIAKEKMRRSISTNRIFLSAKPRTKRQSHIGG